MVAAVFAAMQFSVGAEQEEIDKAIDDGIYAIHVVGYNITTPGSHYTDPTLAEGPPDEIPGTPWKGLFVSLGGQGGYIIATMEEWFTDRPGADIRVYEVGDVFIGATDEPFDVYISSNATTNSWIMVAESIKNDPGKAYASIDIAPIVGIYKYIKVVDKGAYGGDSPGADIDAIETLYPAASVSISTDKYSYTAGDTMHVGLDVTNPGDAQAVSVKIGVEKQDGSTVWFISKPSVTLPAGLEYSKDKLITLPSIPAGIYTWRAILDDPVTGEIICEDTAEWEFVGGEGLTDLTEILKEITVFEDFCMVK